MAYETTRIRGEPHVVTQCITCGVWHTVPEIVHTYHLESGGYHFCPSGHSYGWQQGTKQRDELRLERDRLKQQAAQLQDEIAAQAKRADEAEKKYLKARKRAAAGICPCCNRTFDNVQRHMKTKHPNVLPLSQKTGTST